MATKEYLIATKQWDFFNDRPYEDRTIQAAQHSTFQRSVQALGDLEENKPTTGQSQAGCTPPGCGTAGKRCHDALQITKEAFCVVEEMVKYLESRGHHLSHAHAVGKLYLEQTRPLIS